MITKDEAARTLIQWHFHLDDDLTEIYRFLAPDEDAASEPIKLLEVNPMTREMGFVGPFTFGGAGDIPYPSSIAVVTPEEMAKIKAGEMALPPDWSLDRMHSYQPEPHLNGKG